MPKSKQENRQPFEIKIVKRNEISPHPNNPRIIDEQARKRLFRELDKYGCLAPLLIQKSTMYVISGNQRLDWMDSKHKDKNYDVVIAVCNVTDKQAVTIMVHMNNENAMGSWNLPELEKIIMDNTDVFQDMSFSQLDIEMMFPDNEEFGKLFADVPPAVEKAVAEAQETKRISKEYRRAQNQTVLDRNCPEYYVVVVFNSVAEKRQRMSAIGLPQNEKYIDAEKLIWQR